MTPRGARTGRPVRSRVRPIGALVALLLLAGAGLCGCSRSPGVVTVAGVGPVASTERLAPAESVSTPLRVKIPRIEAESPLTPLGLEPDGTLEVPPVSTPMQAGWYREGPVPGDVGPAVITGHVDGMRRPGIFNRLHELEAGDVVIIIRAGDAMRFVVTETQQVAKEHFPTERVYGDTTVPELRLITCGGVFDRAKRSYRDNIIVYAIVKR
jgi:LPXTG-site transpeptidase (sortase) family protein